MFDNDDNDFPVFLFLLFPVDWFCIKKKRVPDRDKYGPLPDIVLDNVAPEDWALSVSEVQIMVVTNVCILLVIFHKHRLEFFNFC